MHIFHDSRDGAYRSPAGAQPCGARVRIRLRVTDGAPDSVLLRLWYGRESFLPMRPTAQDASLYEAWLETPAEPCLLWYDFQVWAQGQFYWYGNAEDGLGGEGAPVYGEARSFQMTVYAPGFQTPDWARDAVFYQIFPDRFAPGGETERPEGRIYHASWDETPLLCVDPDSGDNEAHDFFGGTLEGIRSKLPYLESLGVTALYLNPIFYASTNHRFDTVDWKRIDPLLGTEDDLRALCRDAAARGIRIILDGVFSHSGSENPFFLQAREQPDSPYRNWYRFEQWPDMYKCWWGFPTLPDLDKNQPEVVRYFLSDADAVVKKWPLAGTDGWRIDVADELPMPYLRLLRAGVKGVKPEAMVLGEVWEDASHKVSYGQMRSYCLGDTLDGVMNYPLREAAIGFLTGALDAAGFKRRMDSLYENYPAPFANALLNIMGSHDRARCLNVLCGMDGENLPREKRGGIRLSARQRALAKRRLCLLLELTVAMPGMPCVYYGDEAGMEGAADPFSRAPFPWGREDEALTALFRTALARKRTLPALSDGALSIEAPLPDVVAVERRSETQRAGVVINRSDRARRVTVFGRTQTLPPYGCATWAE